MARPFPPPVVRNGPYRPHRLIWHGRPPGTPPRAIFALSGSGSCLNRGCRPPLASPPLASPPLAITLRIPPEYLFISCLCNLPEPGLVSPTICQNFPHPRWEWSFIGCVIFRTPPFILNTQGVVAPPLNRGCLAQTGFLRGAPDPFGLKSPQTNCGGVDIHITIFAQNSFFGVLFSPRFTVSCSDRTVHRPIFFHSTAVYFYLSDARRSPANVGSFLKQGPDRSDGMTWPSG